MKKKPDRIYQFALFGKSGTGKTCFLAALGLGQAGADKGISCIRVPVTSLPEEALLDESKLKEHKALLEGQALIEDACQKILAGELPKATEPGTEFPAIEFNIGTTERDYRIRTVDYAGELINPHNLKDSDAFANVLYKELSQYDGLLLLVPTPEDGSLSNDMIIELMQLKEFFNVLSDSKDLDRLVVPVAIALTKWDRLPDFKAGDNDVSADEIKTQVESNNAIHALFVAICNSLGRQPASIPEMDIAGYFKENSAVFATSAFGKLKNDKPDLENVPFGLLEPFLWLVKRRDFLDAHSLQTEWESGLLHKANPLKSMKTFRKSYKLQKRVQGNSSANNQIKQIGRSAFISFATSFSLLVASILFVASATNGVWIRNRLKGMENRLNQPTTSVEELEAMPSLVNYYEKQRRFSLLSPKNITFDKIRKNISEKIEQRIFAPVEVAKTDESKYEAACVYLKKLPNGNHYKECLAFKTAFEQNLADSKNKRFLEEVRSMAENAEKANLLNLMEETKNKIKTGFPSPQAADQKQFDELAKSDDRMSELIAKLKSSAVWEDFVKSYESALQAPDFIQAADLILATAIRDEKWQKLSTDHLARVQAILNKRIADQEQKSDYEASFRNIEKAMAGFKKLEAVMANDEKHKDLADHFLKGQQTLTAMSDASKSNYDKYLYGKVTNNRDLYSCDNYMRRSPLKKRGAEVQAYSDYLNQLNGQLNPIMNVQIWWNPEYDFGDDNMLTIHIDGVVRYDNGKMYIGSTPGQSSGIITSIQQRVSSLDQTFTVSAEILEDDTINYNDDAGQGSQQINCRDLLKGQIQIPLRIPNQNWSNYLLLTLDPASLPVAPNLPEWES